MNYTPFDYMCNEPYFINGIGNIKCPTLREIRKISYNIFSLYLSIISLPIESYIEIYKIEEVYKKLIDYDKSYCTLYYLLLFSNPNILIGFLNFFIVDNIAFNESINGFDIYQNIDGQKKVIGNINNDNFDLLKDELQYILGIKKTEEKEQVFKNKLAQKMYEKIQKHNKKQNQKFNENFELVNMIRKYCTHNKVGINILNVWEMTYYQFRIMFDEYCNARQYDFNDMMAANTFSYKNSSDYKPMEYMKKIK